MKILILMLVLLSCENNNKPARPEQPAVSDPVSESTEAVPVIAPAENTPVIVQPTPVLTPKPDINEIKTIAKNSPCSKYFWLDRGRPKAGYIQGMALVYARAICNQETPAWKIVSGKKGADGSKDVLAHYRDIFEKLGYDNDGGIETARNIYALLIGLGMRESSGRYCCGRDMSANFSSGDSAEAGLFQASWGSRRNSVELVNLYEKYKADPTGCFLGTFSDGYVCREGDLKNWGEGEGLNWQKLTKECPAFAAEWTAILVRYSGHAKGEFGPLRRKAAEVRPECIDMLKQVEDKVLKTDGFCDVIRGHK